MNNKNDFFSTISKCILERNRECLKRELIDRMDMLHFNVLLNYINSFRIESCASSEDYLICSLFRNRKNNEKVIRYLIIMNDYGRYYVDIRDYLDPDVRFHMDLGNDSRLFVEPLNDAIKRNIYGFNRDSDGEEVTIDTSNSYRVQGDVIFNVYIHDNYDKFIDSYCRCHVHVSNFKDVFERTMYSEVCRILEYQYRLPCRVIRLFGNEYRLRVDNALKYHDKRAELKALALKRFVYNIVKSLFNEQLFDEFNDIIVSADSGIWNNYYPLNVYINYSVSKLYADTRNLYKSIICSLKPQKVELWFGNHHIICDLCMPVDVEIDIQLFNRNVTISSRIEDMLFVVPGSTITIIHSEHGIKTIHFKKYAEVVIYNTNQDQFYTNLLHYNIMNLYADYFIKFNDFPSSYRDLEKLKYVK